MITLLTCLVGIELVSQSARVTSVKSAKGVLLTYTWCKTDASHSDVASHLNDNAQEKKVYLVVPRMVSYDVLIALTEH